MPGIFAAGDVRSGSTKRCAAAVGEGSMAVQLVHQHLAAQQPAVVSMSARACTHLDQVEVRELPAQVDGCEDCLRSGGKWLHLRICLTCGHVGCCDDSPNRHATAHHQRLVPPAHPLARAGRGLELVLRRRASRC